MRAWGGTTLLCVVLVVSAQAACHFRTTKGMNIEVTEQSAGKEIDLAVGERFTISLPENPTTGYVWHFVRNGEPVCSLLHDSFSPISHQIGSSGMHEWQFQAASAGRTTLEMRLTRHWDPNTSSRSFLLPVHVT